MRFASRWFLPFMCGLVFGCGGQAARSVTSGKPQPDTGMRQGPSLEGVGALSSAGSSLPTSEVLPYARRWYSNAVMYEVMVRSFQDSDGDGIGDLKGLIQRLDYLNTGDPSTTSDLKVDAIWLMAIFKSPSYHGYDATDYLQIDPLYGTMEDFHTLIREAHRRNIKVLLDSVVVAGDMTAKQRNQLLIRMTDEVAALVLRDNYQQTQAISLARARGRSGFDNHVRLMRMLEKGGHLDRAVEFLPDEETIAERLALKQNLTRAEISVVMSYAKIWLYDQLLDSDLPDDPFLAEDLVTYFPTPLGQRHRAAIESHRLRREIIATKITNSLVNRAGETFVSEFMEKTGMAPSDIGRAYTISRQVFAFRDLWNAIEALDNVVPADVQTRMLLDINHLLDWVTLWFLRNGRRPLDIGTYVQQFGPGMAELGACLNDVLPPHYRDDVVKRAQPYVDQGVPEDLALRVAGLVNLFSGCDIVRLANRRKLKVADVARLYFATGTRFRLGRLRAAAVRLDAGSHWESLAVDALIEEVYGHQLTLTAQVMDDKVPGTDPQEAIQAWVEANKSAVDRAEQILAELWTTEITDVSMIAVASRQLRALADAATER